MARFEREARLLASLGRPNIGAYSNYDLAPDGKRVAAMVPGDAAGDKSAHAPDVPAGFFDETPPPRPGDREVATVTREAAEGGVKQTAKGERAGGSKIDNSYTAKYDGTEVTVTGTNLMYDTTAIKQVYANTLTEERSKKGGKYHASVRTVVSKDGKTTTATQKGTGADGKAFTALNVFEKQ
jgi:hypothetical protein